MTTSWQRLQNESPELAAVVRRRFAAHRHHVLGTIRPDGSPRLSGTEVEVSDEAIGVGMMPDSHKLRDVQRDGRVEIHSAPLEEDLAEGDVKLAGRLAYVGPVGHVDGSAFPLELSRVAHVRVRGDRLEVTSWTPEAGVRAVSRA
jgi:hypothetical protein